MDRDRSSVERDLLPRARQWMDVAAMEQAGLARQFGVAIGQIDDR
jgi:hypothetical protein